MKKDDQGSMLKRARLDAKSTNTAGLDPFGRPAVRKCCRGIIRYFTLASTSCKYRLCSGRCPPGCLLNKVLLRSRSPMIQHDCTFKTRLKMPLISLTMAFLRLALPLNFIQPRASPHMEDGKMAGRIARVSSANTLPPAFSRRKL